MARSIEREHVNPPKLYIAILLIGVVDLALGARRVDIAGRLEVMRRSAGGRVRRSVEAAPSDLFGLDAEEQLKPTETIHTSKNTVKTKYIEEYMGLPIIGESVVLEQTYYGQFTEDSSGSLLENIQEDVPSVVPQLSPEEAFSLAVKAVERNAVVEFHPNRVKLCIFTVGKKHSHAEGKEHYVRAILAYRVTVTIPHQLMPKQVLVTLDANSGQVLQKENLLQSFGHKREACRIRKEHTLKLQAVGGNQKIGKYVYGKDRAPIEVQTEDGLKCRLQNDLVSVIHMNFTHELSLQDENDTVQGFEFDCLQGFNDSINGGYSPLTDAFALYNIVNDMFEGWYGMKAMKRFAIVGVHCSSGLENAFYDSQRNFLCIGDGEDFFYPLASVGVMAHEIGHGFTDDHSGLAYMLQSGGINEAFSDMASEAAQAYMSTTDWLIGAEVTKDNEKALRYMFDPPRDEISISTLEGYCPFMNVHYSSGIFNKAFYSLANRPGWSVRSAFHIFVVANSMYWNTDTTFAEGACGAVEAAEDLGYEAEDVREVFRDVDIEPCEEMVYHFQDTFSFSVSPNQTFEKYFDVSYKETVDIFVIIADGEDSDYNMTITHNSVEVAFLRSNKTESIQLTEPDSGRYHLSIQGNLPEVTLFVTGPPIFQKVLIPFNNSNEYLAYTTFNLGASNFKYDRGVSLRAKIPNDQSFFYTSFRNPVDLTSRRYEHEGIEWIEGFRMVHYCINYPGPYNMAVYTTEFVENETNFTVSAHHAIPLY